MKPNKKEQNKQLARKELAKILGGTTTEQPVQTVPLKITPKKFTPFYHS